MKELKEKLSTIPEDLEIIIHGYDTMPGFYKISHLLLLLQVNVVQQVEVIINKKKKVRTMIDKVKTL